jgi:hypothetical protein
MALLLIPLNREVPVNIRTVEERIRERAYALWEEDGRLEGCDDEYWRQAREMVEKELLESESGASVDSRMADTIRRDAE